MGKRGMLGFLILLIIAVLFGALIGPGKISKMEKAIQTNLNDAGYSDFAKAKMSGNVATLTGTAPSEAAATDAMNVAKNTKCPFCKKKDKVWHEVNNKLEFDTLPTQKPFTFAGQKDKNGRVSITGFVGSEAAKQEVIAKAKAVFGANLVSTSITVANGAPNDDWNRVVGMDMEQLNLLKSGRFEMNERRNFITGEAADAAIRDGIVASGDAMPGNYDFSESITFTKAVVPTPAPAPASAQVNTATECQVLFDEVKAGKVITFESSRANIKGAASFDLLNNIVEASQRCSAFQIAVEGHTDSQGAEAYNLSLSKQRAAEVVNYLGQNGVDTNRLTARGFGETQPVASNATREGRAKNRRIEFTVTQSQ